MPLRPDSGVLCLHSFTSQGSLSQGISPYPTDYDSRSFHQCRQCVRVGAGAAISHGSQSFKMGALRNPLHILNPKAAGPGSREVLGGEASGELIFAVVGHAGSGTTYIADSLGAILPERLFEVERIRARDVIKAWARDRGRPPIPETPGKRFLSDVSILQDYGDEMRAELDANGQSDHSAVARAWWNSFREPAPAGLA